MPQMLCPSTCCVVLECDETLGDESDEKKSDEKLGFGAFAVVVRRGDVAVKMVAGAHKDMLTREYAILHRLAGCPHIVKTLGLRHFDLDDRRSELDLEYGGPCLIDVQIPKAERLSLWVQFAAGVEHMHRLYVAHRDLKIDNILVKKKNEAWELRIIDFNLSLVLTGEQLTRRTLTKAVGSVGYCPPEMCLQQPYNGFDADRWSAGVVAFIIWFGMMPWNKACRKSDKLFHGVQSFVDGGYSPYEALQAFYDLRDGVPAWLEYAINTMLVASADARATYRGTSLLPNGEKLFPSLCASVG